MSKVYSAKSISAIMELNCPVLFELYDGTVSIGFPTRGYKATYILCVPPNINSSYFEFPIRQLKRIVLLSNGLVYPKDHNSRHKILDIFELNDLVNKAGYEFI